MAIARTSLTTGSDTTNTTAYTTASISPTAGALILVAVGATVGSGTTPAISVTGLGLTWVQVDQTVAGFRSVHLFRAMGTPTAGAITITGASQLSSCLWQVTEFTGVDTSGTNGSGAIVQSVQSSPASSASCSVPFGSAVTSGNATFGSVMVSVQELPAAGANWTSMGSTSQSAPTSGLLGEAALTAQQNITASWTTSATHFVVGAEIKAGGATTVTGTGAVTTAAVTASGAGTVTVTGTGAVTTAAVVASGSGTVGSSTVTGTGSVTTAAVVVSGSGTVASATVTGSGAVLLPALAVSGAGTVPLPVTPVVSTATFRPVVSWDIWPRNADLSRTLDPLSGWEKLTLVERLNLPDVWVIEGPTSVLKVFEQPGMGCILDRDGVQIASGSVSRVFGSGSSVGGRTVETSRVAFGSDLSSLGWRIVFPTPAHAVTTAISTFPTAYDVRSGAIETLLLGYIRSNIGDLALADRQLVRLRLPASLSRGGTTQVSARLDNLEALTQALADAGDLRVNIGHTEDAGGSWLDLTVVPLRDVSTNIRFGTADSTAAGIITEWSYEYEAPETTRAIVGLGGEDAAREFLQVKDAAAETLWGHAAETFVDQRNIDPASVDKLAEGTREGQKAIAEGANPMKVTFVPTLGPDLEYRRDVILGDLVGYDLPNREPAEDRVREVTTVVAVESGQPTEQVSVLVGTPQVDGEQKTLRAVTKIQRS